jgi:hypothetical protein
MTEHYYEWMAVNKKSPRTRGLWPLEHCVVLVQTQLDVLIGVCVGVYLNASKRF